MSPSVFVINLDRRPDRLTHMADQFDRLALPWVRVAAHDMQTITDETLRTEIALDRQRIAMGRGSQCCALTNFDIYQRIVAEDLPAAFILQDDVELSPKIAPFLKRLDWLPTGVELVQFEKYGRRQSRRLMGPALG